MNESRKCLFQPPQGENTQRPGRRTQIAPNIAWKPDLSETDFICLRKPTRVRLRGGKNERACARGRITWKSASSNPDPVFQPYPGSWPSIVSPLLAMASRPKCFGSFPGIRRCNDPREFMALRGVSSAVFARAGDFPIRDDTFRNWYCVPGPARWDHLWPAYWGGLTLSLRRACDKIAVEGASSMLTCRVRATHDSRSLFSGFRHLCSNPNLFQITQFK